MDEATIVRGILKSLNKISGVYCLRTHGGPFQQKGTPDIIGCAFGFFFAIEVKKNEKLKPSPAQVYCLVLFNKAGGKTFISCDPKAGEVLKWIGKMRKFSQRRGNILD